MCTKNGSPQKRTTAASTPPASLDLNFKNDLVDMLYFSIQSQEQSATEQLSDEQQFSAQEQSGHPEFPQPQPIANIATIIAINFFIIISFLFIFFLKLIP